MHDNLNLIKQQNDLSKEFQLWKQRRYDNHSSVIDNIEKSSVFYKFKKSSPQLSPNHTSSTPKLANKSTFSQTHNGFFPTKVFSSSLKNFRKTIIKDSIKNKDHLLNQLGQAQENAPFVPYFYERDKLGRLVKEERSDVNLNEVNILNHISISNQQSHYKIVENVLNDDSNHQNTGLPSNNFQEEEDDHQFQQKNMYVKGGKHKKSLSHIPFGSSSNNISTNQIDKMRSSTTLYPSISNISSNANKNKLNQLLNGIGSFSQISMVQLPETTTQAKNTNTFMNPRSFQMLNFETIDSRQSKKNSLLEPKYSIPSLSQLHQNRSFTQLISYNSSPCSPSRYITKIQSNNNSMAQEDKIIEFDKNNQLKCSQDEVIRKAEAFHQKHQDARKKKDILEQNIQPYKFKAKVLPLKFPESAKASHACRVLFNHHKKIQKFNQMIDRNDPNIVNFEIDHRQKNADKCKNVMDMYKQRFSLAAGFLGKKQENIKEARKIQKEEKRQKMLEKWGERVDSSELDDEEEKYKKKILNPILTKEQQLEQERAKRSQIFNDYDKWYTLQMYYIEKGDEQYKK